jgi:hypothetical protein
MSNRNKPDAGFFNLDLSTQSSRADRTTTTFNLSPEVRDSMGLVIAQLQTWARKANLPVRPLNKSTLADTALIMALEDIQRNGPQSAVVRRMMERGGV